MALSLTSSTPDPDSKWIRQQLILDPLPENEVDYRSPYFVAQGIPTQHFLPIYGHNKLPSTLQATVPYQKALYSDEEAEFLLESPWKPVPKTVPCDTIIDVEPALEVNLNTRDVQTAKFLAGPWLPASASRAARLAPIRKNETVAAATVHKSPRVPRPRQTTQASPQKTLKPAAYQSRRAFHTVKAPLPKTVSVKKVLQKRGPVADPGSPGRRAASSCPDSVQGLSDAPSNPLERELDSDRASVADVLDHEQYVMLQVWAPQPTMPTFKPRRFPSLSSVPSAPASCSCSVLLPTSLPHVCAPLHCPLFRSSKPSIYTYPARPAPTPAQIWLWLWLWLWLRFQIFLGAMTLSVLSTCSSRTHLRHCSPTLCFECVCAPCSCLK